MAEVPGRRVVVDTDILIDAGRGDPTALDYLGQLEENCTVAVSVITQMELTVGCRNKQELRQVEGFLRRFEVVHLSEKISAAALDLLRTYRLSHGLLIPDALIAATSSESRAPLATKNQSDFRFIQDLDLLAYPARQDGSAP